MKVKINSINWSIHFLIVLIFTCCKREDNVKVISTCVNVKVENGKKTGKHLLLEKEELVAIVNYKNDTTDGETILFHSNGNIRSKHNFKENTLNGMAYYFYESGVLEGYRKWKEGVKVGYAVDYYDTIGRVESVMLYNDSGHLVYKKSYDKSGSLINTEGSIDDIEVLKYFNQLKSGNVSEIIE